MIKSCRLRVLGAAAFGGDTLIVDNVLRKSGVRHVEGLFGSVITVDIDATSPPPMPGQAVQVRPRRANLHSNRSPSHEQA